jgi:M6 family metalloprotease-like protein
MRKLLVGLVAVLSLSLVTSQVSVAAVKPGTKCSKAGATSTSDGKKYTCIKSGKKLVWNKGVVVAKPKPVVSPTPEPTPTPTPSSTQTVAPTPVATPTPTIRDWVGTRSTDLGYINEYRGPCDLENDLPTVFNQLQSAYSQGNFCSGIYRVAKYELGFDRPKTLLDSNTSDLAIKNCELSEPKSSMNQRGFFNFFDSNRSQYLNASKIPGPNMTVQIIPIFSSDTASPKNSPEEDYGSFTDVVSTWAKYSSDGESSVDVRFPSTYIEFPNKVSSYNIDHEKRHDSPEHSKFVQDLVEVVDSKINFSGTNLVIVVVPPGTPLANFQQGSLKNFATREGTIRHGSTMYPFTLGNLQSVKHPNFLSPFWWIHELYHSGFGLDDHYGDTKRNVNTEYGMGQWTLMTPYGGDLSAWEKWILGFITNSQVHCVNPNVSTVRWIAPSSVKTKEKKLVVIPISQTKGIVLESIRAAGLYYKISKESEGVLPYLVDLEIVGHGLGLKLILPTNRNPDQPPFFLSQAPLRQGESVTSNGFKITVVESGTFGDVIKVEKS